MPNTNDSSEAETPRSADADASVDAQPVAPQDSANPMEGGRWRPVRPEELLRKNPPSVDMDGSAEPVIKVRRQRRQELEHHVRSCPTDIEAYRELAAIYRKDERPQEAARVLTEAGRLFPDDPTLLWELEEARLARSLQQYREVSDLAARLKTPEVDRELKRSRDDWAYRRIEICKARLARDPSHKHLRLVLAEAQMDCEQHDEAIVELDELLKLDEFSSQASLLKGRCLLQLGRDAEAMVSLRAAGLRRAVVAPLPIRVAALRLLCDTAERLGIELTLEHYRNHLATLEQDLAKQAKPS
ncbi:tetratricopeptide repeat protein [Novipirellula artificiosorum]|uniref:Tetratricopeptide repeat protein n=1 Tax=Novipirellula artificiosorum TaxID=2528016 RepID=A0A5C6DA00_9BACT|nr:tetratricopeptide repeat protein [Novipirellula artificiosorum]TWU33710.1 Tetratricopeptide repeat protein [Novipirellula artificiosorum]